MEFVSLNLSAPKATQEPYNLASLSSLFMGGARSPVST